MRALRWEILIYLLGIVFGLAAFIPQGQARNDVPRAVAFHVKKIKGEVLIQEPLSNEWSAVTRSMTIPEDSLLQVMPGASITMDAMGSLNRVGVPISSSTVSINKAMIIRVNIKSFRRIQMDSKLLAALPDANSLQVMQKHLKGFDAMIDAWKQDATMLAGTDWIDDDMFKQLADATSGKMANDDVSVTGKIGKINLFNPKDQQMTWASDLPVELNMSWSVDNAEGKIPDKFKVYLWKKGQGRQVFAFVKGNRFQANLSEEGKYFIQVESTDGSYKSELRTVDVKRRNMRPGTVDDNVVPSTEEPAEALTKVLNHRTKLLSPVADLRWHSSQVWPVMEFRWTRPVVAWTACQYKFTVNDAQKKNVVTLTSSSERLEWQPPAQIRGMLVWQVETLTCDNPKGEQVKMDTKSNARRLFFEGPESVSSAMSPFKKPKSRGYVYLDL